MKDVETVRIELQYSRAGIAIVCLSAGATVALAWALPVALALRIALAAWVAALGLGALERAVLLCGRRAARRLRVQRDGAIEVESASGIRTAGVLRAGSFVAPWLVIVRWRPHGGRWDRTVLLLPDMVAAEEFRRLRVLLRWA
jgi:toxin CptA